MMHTNSVALGPSTIGRKNPFSNPRVFLFSTTYEFSSIPTEPNEPKRPSPAAHFRRFSQPFALPLHPLDE
jgi:hypothetical protein